METLTRKSGGGQYQGTRLFLVDCRYEYDYIDVLVAIGTDIVSIRVSSKDVVLAT